MHLFRWGFWYEKNSYTHVQKYEINDFVIVDYKGEYFSRMMKDLCKGYGKTMTEYQVAVKAMSVFND